MDDQLMALLKGLKEVEEAQKKAGSPVDVPKKPEPARLWTPPPALPVRTPEKKPEPEPRKRAFNIPLPKGAENLDREGKQVSAGDVLRKKKVYGRDNFRDED